MYYEENGEPKNYVADGLSLDMANKCRLKKGRTQ